jgi:hypothetical protein
MIISKRRFIETLYCTLDDLTVRQPQDPDQGDVFLRDLEARAGTSEVETFFATFERTRYI